VQQLIEVEHACGKTPVDARRLDQAGPGEDGSAERPQMTPNQSAKIKFKMVACFSTGKSGRQTTIFYHELTTN
jgi:hypothetical protein